MLLVATPDAADTFVTCIPRSAPDAGTDAPLISGSRREVQSFGRTFPSCFSDVGLPASEGDTLLVFLLDCISCLSQVQICSYACGQVNKVFGGKCGFLHRTSVLLPPAPDLASLWIHKCFDRALEWSQSKEAAQAITIDHGHGGVLWGDRPNNATCLLGKPWMALRKSPMMGCPG